MLILSSQIPGKQPQSKVEVYNQLAAQLSSLLAGERDLIANAANFSSLIFHSLPDLNWAGFYFVRDGELWVLAKGWRAAVQIDRSSGKIIGRVSAGGIPTGIAYASGAFWRMCATPPFGRFARRCRNTPAI